ARPGRPGGAPGPRRKGDACQPAQAQGPAARPAREGRGRLSAAPPGLPSWKIGARVATGLRPDVSRGDMGRALKDCLRLRAVDAEDLRVIAACLQDALIPLHEMVYLPE